MHGNIIYGRDEKGKKTANNYSLLVAPINILH